MSGNLIYYFIRFRITSFDYCIFVGDNMWSNLWSSAVLKNNSKFVFSQNWILDTDDCLVATSTVRCRKSIEKQIVVFYFRHCCIIANCFLFLKEANRALHYIETIAPLDLMSQVTRSATISIWIDNNANEYRLRRRYCDVSIRYLVGTALIQLGNITWTFCVFSTPTLMQIEC